jgi:4-amino-4-deoxy-L-arabinose transferase-like glycosyltransferase
LTVLLVGWAASVWHGPLAGALAALAMALTPRLFGHAHLASLETFLNLVWWGALLGVAALAGDPRPRMGRVAACGALFGLVLLTKIQAVLLPIPVAAWMIWRWRGLGAAAAAVWGTAGLAVFFAGWPWLWGDPWGRGLGFLATASDRAPVMVWYFGERLADRDVPWHYPFVMTIATVPVGLAALALAGGWAAFVRPRSDAAAARDLLLAGGGLFPLVVFSLPGVAVYDSERLFLMSFVTLALFAGRGAAAALETFQDGWHALAARGGLAALLVWQLLALVQMSPVWLGYYSECVGGPRGAERLGLATTYWGDGLTRTLLLRTADELPDGQPLEVLPVLHPRWLPALLSQTPAFQAREMRLIPFVDERPHARERWLLMFPRREYCTPGWTDRPPGWEPVAEVRRGGVSYGGLYRWRK